MAVRRRSRSRRSVIGRPPRRPDFDVQSDQLLQRRIRRAGMSEAVDCGAEQPWDPVEVETAAQEARHGHLIGRDQGGAGPRPGNAGLAGDTQRRETLLVGGPELQPAGRDQVDRDRRGDGRRSG